MEQELLPLVQKKLNEHKELCAKRGITIQVTSTYRSIEDQDKLYAQGRTAPGKYVVSFRTINNLDPRDNETVQRGVVVALSPLEAREIMEAGGNVEVIDVCQRL